MISSKCLETVAKQFLKFTFIFGVLSSFLLKGLSIFDI